MSVRPIHPHHVLLIAGSALASALEDQLLTVVAEIGFGILTAVGQLPNISEMRLPRFRRNRNWAVQRLRGDRDWNQRRAPPTRKRAQKTPWKPDDTFLLLTP